MDTNRLSNERAVDVSRRNIHLKAIAFLGFKGNQKTARVSFSDSAVSVIYGDNGSGKTTFLKAISAFLSQDDATLASLGITEVSCEYVADGELHSLNVKREDISYNWSELVESPLKESKSIALGVERGISTQSLRIEASLIYEFFRRSPRARSFFRAKDGTFAEDIAQQLSQFLRQRQNALRDRKDEFDDSRAHQNLQNIKLENIEKHLLNHYRRARYFANLKIQSALFNTLSDAISGKASKQEVPGGTRLDIFEYRDRLIEALTNDDLTEANEFKATVVQILASLTEDNYSVEIESKPLLISLFANMIEELEKEKLALSAVNLLVETFNRYLIDSKKIVISGSEIYVSTADGDRHSLHELSSGERHILTFLSLVLFLGQDRDFLIIDEPEISLNITWQRQLLDLFTKLVPNTQIIVASHSPIIARRRPEYLTPLTLSQGLEAG